MSAAMHSDKPLRQRLTAQVHIARKDLALDDDAYRLLLENETGQRSCSDLTVAQLRKVLQRLQVAGWKPRRRYSPRSRHQVVDVLRAVWIQMAQAGMVADSSETALEAWVRRQTRVINKGVGVDKIDWLERDWRMAQRVVESLKQWRDRVLKSWCNADLRLISREQRRRDVPQPQVIRELLDAGRIMYWPIFDDLGIEEQDYYIRDRRLLHE